MPNTEDGLITKLSELRRNKLRLQNDLGKVEDQIMELTQKLPRKYISRPEEIRWSTTGQAAGWKGKKSENRIGYRVLPELGFDAHNFFAFQMEVPPHSSEGAYHKHGEAIKYYLSGRGKEIIEDQVYDVRAGDIAFIPANKWHGTENPYDEPLVFVAVATAPLPVMVPAPFVVKEELRV